VCAPVKAFDILYLNGKSLLNNSAVKRRDLLRFALKEVPGHVEHTVQWTGTTAKDIRKKMNDIMEKRGEGLVIKHPKAMYLLNGRNLDWIKVKPEYMVCPGGAEVSNRLIRFFKGQYGRDSGPLGRRYVHLPTGRLSHL